MVRYAQLLPEAEMTLYPPRPDRWPQSLKGFVVLVAVAAILMGCWLAFASWFRKEMSYAGKATFAAMPPNDHDLRSWLREQPGVVGTSVGTSRPNATTLIVAFSMSRSLRGDPKLPDLDEECKSLGYRGAYGHFEPYKADVFFDP